MEEYFKFIPVALWVLYKIFGGSKSKEQKPKQRTQRQSRPKSNPATPSIEDILRELSGGTKKKEPSVKMAAPETQSKKIEIVDHQYDFRPEYEHHADTGPNLDQIKKEIKREKHIAEKTEPVEIDLRKAVIYDAILNRPSY